ncbi:unnamed protein product [Caenorhabditis auriculariae]|uniref:C-type lectin domain-containing protein n=1 Tax=Caenorhabditis auriculariae TaxID=2777116 RepID=A0A8S1HTV5_9PELO|nr:unnamed protein product [Caenorhabditis auriculariae]
MIREYFSLGEPWVRCRFIQFYFFVFLVTRISADCPGGSTLSADGKLCYKAIQTSVSYREAKTLCGLLYGGLPLVPNAFTNAFLDGLLNQDGLFFSWLPYSYSNGAYRTDDGSMPTFTNWAPGEPRLQNGYAVQLRSSDGRWTTTTVDAQNSVICAFSPSCAGNQGATTPFPRNMTTPRMGYTTPGPTPSTNPCLAKYKTMVNPCLDETWEFYPRTCSCYKIVTATYFDEAQSTCYKYNPTGGLTSIHSDAEAIFVSDLAIAAQGKDDWIVRGDIRDNTLIGLFRQAPDYVWRNADATPYDGYPGCRPTTSPNANYAILITANAIGYRGFGSTSDTEDFEFRNAVCKYPLQ